MNNNLLDLSNTTALEINGSSVSKLEINDTIIWEKPLQPLLTGAFSVSKTKKVQFTSSNLYWNGSEFKLEKHPYDFPGIWDANHVGHFFWISASDYQRDPMYYTPYSKSYNYYSRNSKDVYWCGVDNPITVNNIENLYVLTGGSSGEWNYLLTQRTNASNLYKTQVTVDDTIGCLIIAPDDYDYINNPLKDKYTTQELLNLSLVCLPPNGERFETDIIYNLKVSETSAHIYMSTATPYTSGSNFYAYYVFGYYNLDTIEPTNYGVRNAAHGIRLVKTIE